MNTADDRLRLPPPPGCLACAKRETWITLGIPRHRCRDGHPMHESCGFRVQANPGMMHMNGDLAARAP